MSKTAQTIFRRTLHCYTLPQLIVIKGEIEKRNDARFMPILECIECAIAEQLGYWVQSFEG